MPVSVLVVDFLHGLILEILKLHPTVQLEERKLLIDSNLDSVEIRCDRAIRNSLLAADKLRSDRSAKTKLLGLLTLCKRLIY